jgi:hypothetical protein
VSIYYKRARSGNGTQGADGVALDPSARSVNSLTVLDTLGSARFLG